MLEKLTAVQPLELRWAQLKVNAELPADAPTTLGDAVFAIQCPQSSSARASSVSRSRGHCANGGWRCMSSGPKLARWSPCSARRSETSCVRSTRSTASPSTSIPISFDRSGVSLRSGERLAADSVVVGIGVRPETALADHSGIAVTAASLSTRISRQTFRVYGPPAT